MLAGAVAMPIGGIAIRACAKLPPTIEKRIADNRAQTQADSILYRQALAMAAMARGWKVHWYERDQVPADASSKIKGGELDAVLRTLGKSAGAPWQARHKLAAAAAIAAR